MQTTQTGTQGIPQELNGPEALGDLAPAVVMGCVLLLIIIVSAMAALIQKLYQQREKAMSVDPEKPHVHHEKKPHAPKEHHKHARKEHIRKARHRQGRKDRKGGFFG